jgi:hypothetical protein
MRTLIAISVIVAMTWPATAGALTGISIGGHVGVSNVSGDVLPGSGDLGSATTYGVVLGIGTVPMLDLQIRGGYFAKDFAYTYTAGTVTATTGFRYEDASVTALLRKNVFTFPASPISLYLGAGAGMHWMNTEIAQAIAQGAGTSTEELVGSTAKPSAIGIVGIDLSAPVFPLAVFGEYSYEAIFASERLSASRFGAGLMLRF